MNFLKRKIITLSNGLHNQEGFTMEDNYIQDSMKLPSTHMEDTFQKAESVIGLLEEHPEVGVVIGGGMITAGVGAVIVYGRKLMSV